MATRTTLIKHKTWVNKAALISDGRVVILDKEPSDTVAENYHTAEIAIEVVEEVFEVTASEFNRMCEKIKDEYPNRQAHTSDVLNDVRKELGL